MDSIDQILSAWLQDVFRQKFPGTGDFAEVAVVAATDPAFGDYQCNAALALARQLKKPPRAIAQAVASHKPMSTAVAALDVAGAGFINIRLSDEWLAQRLETMARDERLGISAPGAGRTVVLDYSGPNIAKPMHIGHIRSTVIGNALDRLYRFLGYRVIADNHLGDWGTQFGILIMGYRHFVDRAKLSAAPIEELERIYVLSYEKSEADADWKAQCRQELVKLQALDPENRALWKQFVELSLSEFARLYQRLGVEFDLTRGESYYQERLAGIVARLEQQLIARESEGACVVFLDDEKLPACIVRKSDGAYNYATTDLATVLTRVEEFQPERIIYVTDERQQLHFAQIFAICRRLGVMTKLEHVWFGLMRLPEGVFSTRQGNVIKLEKLLDEAESRALAVVRETSPEMPPEQQQEVARAVGIGAVKYADLSQNPQSLVTFSWDKALALNGNSAPYLQYSYARIRSVEDKYKEQFPGKELAAFPFALREDIEHRLAVQLARFAELVPLAARLARPSVLADYLYELAGCYNTFYQNVPFLKAPEGVRESRVRICGLVARVLGQGLNLLGIATPERI